MPNSHGTFSLRQENNIIFITLIGSFNEYGLSELAHNLKNRVIALSGERFAILINDTEMEGGTPEAYEELNELNIWLNTKNMVAKAVVVKYEMTLDIIKSRAPALKTQNIKTFHLESQAFSWLKEELND